MLTKIATIIATGFGLGYSPVASGTAGSLLGCLIVWGITISGVSLSVQIALCVAMTLASVPICSAAEKGLDGKKDDGRIVADEYLTLPICMLGLYDKWMTAEFWWLMPVCFVVCRAMDILKPFPAYRSQKLPSGLGITIDDLIASLYALGINWIIFRLVAG